MTKFRMSKHIAPLRNDNFYFWLPELHKVISFVVSFYLTDVLPIISSNLAGAPVISNTWISLIGSIAHKTDSLMLRWSKSSAETTSVPKLGLRRRFLLIVKETLRLGSFILRSISPWYQLLLYFSLSQEGALLHPRVLRRIAFHDVELHPQESGATFIVCLSPTRK